MLLLLHYASRALAAPTLQQPLHHAGAALAKIAQQRHAAVHQQAVLVHRLRLTRRERAYGIHEEGVYVAVDGVVLVLLLLRGQHGVLLTLTPSAWTHEGGKVWNLAQGLVVLRVVQQQQLAAVARPVVSLLCKTRAHHFVDEVGELGAGGGHQLAQAVDDLVVVLLLLQARVLQLLEPAADVQHALRLSPAPCSHIQHVAVLLVHQIRLWPRRRRLHDGHGARVQRRDEVRLPVIRPRHGHFDVLLEEVGEHHQRAHVLLELAGLVRVRRQLRVHLLQAAYVLAPRVTSTVGKDGALLREGLHVEGDHRQQQGVRLCQPGKEVVADLLVRHV